MTPWPKAAMVMLGGDIYRSSSGTFGADSEHSRYPSLPWLPQLCSSSVFIFASFKKQAQFQRAIFVAASCSYRAQFFQKRIFCLWRSLHFGAPRTRSTTWMTSKLLLRCVYIPNRRDMSLQNQVYTVTRFVRKHSGQKPANSCLSLDNGFAIAPN